MARITTYGNDLTVSLQDRLLGSDSQTNGTKNFPIESIVDFLNNSGLVDVFDGVLYQFEAISLSNTDPQGIINITGTSALATNFSAITSLIISDKGKDSIDYTQYFSGLTDYRIKISQTDNKNNYGIFKITAQEEWTTDDKYRQLTLQHQSSNGQLTPGKSYFISIFQASIDSDLSARSVTEFGDVTSAGSGAIITSAERTIVSNALLHSDVVNNVTTTTSNVPLSANQGKLLKDEIDAINTLLTSDNVNLDTLQEVVDYIETNRSDLDSLTISNITGLQAALDGKVAIVAGKGLSANDFTDVLLTKLNSIATGAEVNVQTNWNETDNTSDAFIVNKPTDVTDLSLHDVTETADVFSAGSGYIITDAERTKLTGIDAGAEVNVNADWNATTGDAQILNKPGVVQYDSAQSLTSGQQTQALSNVGITASTTEINTLDGITSSTAELNKLTGVTATTTEINYIDGVTSDIQTQIDGKQATITAGSIDPDKIAQDGAANGQALVWNNTSGQWEPGTIASSGGTIDGSGTAGTIPKMSDSDTITDSVITEDGSGNIGISQSTPTSKLDVTGDVNITGDILAAEYIKHAGDTDTNIQFGANDIKFTAGNNEHIHISSTGTVFNDSTSKSDVRVETSNNENTFFVDASEDKIGIKTNTPSVSLDINSNDAVQMPSGTTGERPTGANGMFRYNSTDNQFEGYADGSWGAIAGSGGGGSSSVARQTHSADGNTLAFAIGQSITDENNVSVYIDGVYQEKSTFSVSGSTLTFGTGNEPPNGTTVEIISYGSVPATTDVGQVQNDTFSITTPTTAFTLSIAPTNKAHTLVYINGVYQEKSTYSLSGTTLTLSSSAEVGDTVEVESRAALAPTGLTYSNLEFDLFTATAAQTSFTLVNGTPADKSQTLVYINGVYQNKSTYSLTSGAIVLSTGADAGDEVEVVSMEGLVAPNIGITDDSVSTAKLQDNSITSDKVGNEFKTSSSLTAAATVNVDYTSAQIFTLTPNASTTLNITNPVIGVSKSIIVTGAGSSYTLTFNVGGAAGTFNKISGDYDDTASTKNFIQLTCVSATEFWYSISQIAT